MTGLFEYPKSAAFGRVLPKNKIYQHGGLSRKMQQAFVDQVDQIIWAYKLAPETINLPAGQDVTEIQIFRIKLRERAIRQDTLAAIDRTVAFPIIFELQHGGQVQITACHKRPSEADSAKWVISDYFSSSWLQADAERQKLPVALDMARLYEALLSPLLPDAVKVVVRHAKPDLRSQVARVEELKALEARISKIESRLSREKQFNRKVEINAELREAKSRYKSITVKPLGEPEAKD